MYPAPIEEYLPSATVDEALDALAARRGWARVIAGGMSLMRLIKSRRVEPRCLIDLGRLDALRKIDERDGGLRIGALVRYKDLATESRLAGTHQALRDAARVIGDRQVRNRGTLGGNLCFNDLAADLPPVALALDFELEIARAGTAPRTVAAERFLGAPGNVALDDAEIVTAISLARREAGTGSAYLKYGFTVDGPPVVGVAAAISLDADGRAVMARFAVGGVPRCCRSRTAEMELIGSSADDVEVRRAALEAAASEVETQDDLWSTASHRKALIRDLGNRALDLAFTRAGGST